MANAAIDFIITFVYVLVAGFYVGMATKSFKSEHFIRFGIEATWALLSAVMMITRVTSWLA